MAKKKSAFDRLPQRPLGEAAVERINSEALQLLQQGQFQAGADLLSQSVALNPRQPQAYYNFGYALQQLGLLDSAIQAYGQSIVLAPQDAEARMARGHAYATQKRFDEALVDFARATRLQPQDADTWNNYGNVLLELNREIEAVEAYDKALALRPFYPQACFNKGKALHELERYSDSAAAYTQALQQDPGYVEAAWHLSWIYLLQGDYARGWREFEARWDVDALGYKRRHTAVPLWLGESSLVGKTILLHAEQGLGDTLQFCRYVPQLIAQGATVLLEVPQSLLGLLRSLHPAVQLFAMGSVLPAFDVQCPLMSLPLACATSLDSMPAMVPYLAVDGVDQARWLALLGPKEKLRIGLVWSGSPGHKNDDNRSMPLSVFAPLFDEVQADFISLQPEVRAEDAAWLQAHPEVQLQRYPLNDFVDTAALIENIDLVITVDTSVAHLAGALAKPVWVLLSTGPDYRWLLDREDSPWYPTARLFRQIQRRDWAGVVVRVVEAVKRFSAPRTDTSK